MRDLHRLAVVGCVVLAIAAAGCGSESKPPPNAAPVGSPGKAFGNYPAKTSLSPKEVVTAYVDALDRRDGRAYCSVVASWISGTFDVHGSDPEASLRRPVTCPQIVSGFIGYIEDCCPPKFLGARVADFGPSEKKGTLLRVPVTVELELEEHDVRRTEQLEDVVWLVRERKAWRVAYPSRVSAAASIGTTSDPDFTARPNVARLRAEFVALRNELERRVAAREASYLPVGEAPSCEGGLRIPDPKADIDDYQHPAPQSPTPQLPYADLAAAVIATDARSICMQWELAGEIRLPTTFTVYVATELDGRDAGQNFEIDVRRDGRARIVGGLDLQRHEYTLPGLFGITDRVATLVVDERTFAVARQRKPLTKYRPVFPLGTDRFAFGFGVSVRVSPQRLLHDGLGGTPATGRFTYPSGEPCTTRC